MANPLPTKKATPQYRGRSDIKCSDDRFETEALILAHAATPVKPRRLAVETFDGEREVLIDFPFRQLCHPPTSSLFLLFRPGPSPASTRRTLALNSPG